MKELIHHLTWQEAKKYADKKFDIRLPDISSNVAATFLIGQEMSKLMENEFFTLRDLSSFKKTKAYLSSRQKERDHYKADCKKIERGINKLTQ
jgi:hypothetical protein